MMGYPVLLSLDWVKLRTFIGFKPYPRRGRSVQSVVSMPPLALREELRRVDEFARLIHHRSASLKKLLPVFDF